MSLPHHVLPLLTALSLCACANAANTPSETVKETATMPTDTPAIIQPKLTAEQALLRLLELIRTSKTIADFTPERLSDVMGVPVTPRSDGYGFGEKVTPQWGHGFDVTPQRRFDYGFSPNPIPAPGTPDPPMTDLCQVDFDRFTAELEAMGFSRSHNYDSPPSPPIGEPALPHGRLMYDGFDRPGLGIEVYPEGEHARTPHKEGGRLCVKMVIIY